MADNQPTSYWGHLLMGLDEEADPYASAYERLTMPNNAIAATKEVVRLRTEMEKMCQRWQGDLDVINSLGDDNDIPRRIAHAHITMCLNDLKNILEANGE